MEDYLQTSKLPKLMATCVTFSGIQRSNTYLCINVFLWSHSKWRASMLLSSQGAGALGQRWPFVTFPHWRLGVSLFIYLIPLTSTFEIRWDIRKRVNNIGEVQSLLEFPDDMLEPPGSWGRVNETTSPTALFYFFHCLLIAEAKVPVWPEAEHTVNDINLSFFFSLDSVKSSTLGF